MKDETTHDGKEHVRFLYFVLSVFEMNVTSVVAL